MKKIISGLSVLLFAVIFSTSANAAPGDLFVQIDLEDGPGDTTQCSILKIAPNGTFTEFVSFTDIIALTGDDNCEMDDEAIAVADNGDVYFSEDESDSIIMATPAGALSTFVSEAQITAVTGSGNADIDNGMVIGPDGDLYFADANSDSILKATIPGGVVSLVLSEAQIIAVTGNTEANLNGGIAFDCSGNLYISDDANNEESDQKSILVLSPAGFLSVFVSEQEIVAATGFDNIDLDSGMTFFDSLFVNDDGNCDCVLRITLGGAVSVFVSEDQITAVTGNDDADVDGGNAVNQMREVFIGDDGSLPDDSNVLMSNPNGSSLSIVVSNQQLEDFYPAFGNPRLQGNMAFEGVEACQISQIPTLSEWGLIAMAGVLGIIGLLAVRRRKAAI